MSSKLPAGTKEQRRVNEQEALRLRLAGAQYSDIAEQIGYRNASDAKKAADRAFKRLHLEPTEQQLRLALARYERLLLSVWVPATNGVIAAVREARACQDAITKLLGLNAPEKFHISWDEIIEDTRKLAREKGMDEQAQEEAVQFVMEHMGLDK